MTRSNPLLLGLLLFVLAHSPLRAGMVQFDVRPGKVFHGKAGKVSLRVDAYGTGKLERIKINASARSGRVLCAEDIELQGPQIFEGYVERRPIQVHAKKIAAMVCITIVKLSPNGKLAKLRIEGLEPGEGSLMLGSGPGGGPGGGKMVQLTVTPGFNKPVDICRVDGVSYYAEITTRGNHPKVENLRIRVFARGRWIEGIDVKLSDAQLFEGYSAEELLTAPKKRQKAVVSVKIVDMAKNGAWLKLRLAIIPPRI